MLVVIFGITLAVQAGILMHTRITPILRDLASVRGATALERSATLAFGDEFAAYMDFLRKAVPRDGQIVVPPMSMDPVLGNIGLMQYFLLPRQLVNCPAGPDLSACIRSMSGPTTYTLNAANFPNPADVPADRSLLAFNAERGVYTPPQQGADDSSPDAAEPSVAPPPVSPFIGQAELQWVSGILWLAALGSLGWLLVATVNPRQPAWQLAGTFFPLGLGVTTWFTFCLSRLGVPLDWRTVMLTVGALMLAGLVARRRHRAEPRPQAPRPTARAPLRLSSLVEAVLLGMLLAAILLQMRLSVGQSYSEWDAMAIWSAKGYGIAHEGGVLAAANWGAHGLSYPLNIPLGIALMRIVQGDTEPASKLIFPLFYASLIAGCMLFWMRRGLALRLAAAGGLLIATVPVIFSYGSNGYANLPFAAYLVLGALCLVEGLADRHSPMIVAGGLLLGFASWTRVEGVVYAAAILGLGLLAALALRRPLRPVIAATLLALAGYGPWWAASTQTTSSSVVGQAVTSGLATLQAGGLHGGEVVILARVSAKHLLTPATWGLLVPAVALLLAWSLLRRPRAWDLTVTLVVASAAVTASVTAGILYVRSLTLAGISFSLMLDRSLDRHLFPALILLAVAAILAAGAITRSGVAPNAQDSSR